MAETLGTIRGQLILDVKQALAAYTDVRQQHVATITALRTGGNALIGAGAAVAGVGIAMGAGILYAVDAASQFEKRLDYFAAVSGATQKEYEAISEKALQLGADTQYSANEIADSFVELSKSGVDASRIIDGIGEAVANLGSAGDLPLADAAKSLTTILNTFGIEAKDSVAVVDQLAGAANSSSIGVQDLITTITYAGASAKVAGIEFSDINTAIALLGERGIAGSKAGTGLRQMIDKLIAPTKGGTAALKEMGIITADGVNNLLEMDGSLKPIPALLDTLNGSLAGLTTNEKVDLLGRIFPITSLPTILSLLDGGSDAMARLNGEIGKTTAADVASQRLDNLAGDIEILRGNIDTMLIEAGGSFQEFARTVVQSITEAVNAFSALPDEVQTGIVTFTAIGAVVLAFVGFLGMLAGSVMNIIALGITLSTTFPVIGTIFGAIATAAKAMWAAVTGPVGIVIAIIAVVVGALVWFFTQTEVGKTAWQEFTRFLTEAWTNIVTFAQNVWEGLPVLINGVWTAITTFINDAINGILYIFYNFTPLGIIISKWDGIIGFFVGLWNTVTTGISNFVTGAINFFTSLPATMISGFQKLPAFIGYALGFLLGVITRVFLTIGTWIVTNVPIIVNNVVTFFQELPAKVIAFFTDMYVGVTTWVQQMAVDVLVWSINLVTGVIGFFQALPENISTFFQAMYANAVNWVREMAFNVIIWALNAYNGIIQWIQAIPGAVLGFFQGVYNNIVNTFTNAVNVAIEIANNIKNGITNAINGLPALVTGIFNNVVNAIKDMVRKAFNAVKDFAAGLWEGFKDGLGIHSPSYIEHAMWAITGVIDTETQRMAKQVRTIQGLGNGITEIGRNIGNGFGDNMSAGMQSLYDQVASAKALQTSISMGSTVTATLADSTQAKTLAGIEATLKELKDRPQEINYDIVSNNPVPEKTSESIPKSIRAATFVTA